MAYFSLSIPAGANTVRFPSVQPTQNVLKQMTIGANRTNVAAVSCQAFGALQPGTTVTFACDDPGALLLSGQPGDGIGINF